MKKYPFPAHAEILSLKPYVGGSSAIEGMEHVIKLSSNENALRVNPNVVQACRDHVPVLFRYPDGGSQNLRKAIAQTHQIDPERIVCANGSDELIGLLCHAYLKAQDEIIITQYAFLMYRLYAIGCGASVTTVAEKNFKVDLDAILKAITDKTKIVFIANPGNPTGTYLSKDEIINFCHRLPTDVMLVIDAAYAEFVDAQNFDAGISIVDEFPNVVMLRTFSKIYGLGGLRLGWSYASKEITDVLNRVRGPFNVNSMAQVAGVAAVQDRAFVEKAFEHNKKWLKILQKELTDIGLEVTPSVTNFILVHFPSDKKTAHEADAYLLSHGIIVRRVDSYGLPNALRMTIGNDEEMETLLKTLKEFMTV